MCLAEGPCDPQEFARLLLPAVPMDAVQLIASWMLKAHRACAPGLWLRSIGSCLNVILQLRS